MHQIVFANSPRRVEALRARHETRMAVGDFLRTIHVDAILRSRIDAP